MNPDQKKFFWRGWFGGLPMGLGFAIFVLGIAGLLDPRPMNNWQAVTTGMLTMVLGLLMTWRPIPVSLQANANTEK